MDVVMKVIMNSGPGLGRGIDSRSGVENLKVSDRRNFDRRMIPEIEIRRSSRPKMVEPERDITVLQEVFLVNSHVSAGAVLNFCGSQ